MADPLKYYRTNLQGSIVLLSVLKKTSCRKFLFSSSCTNFDHRSRLVDESDHHRPINPYARSKPFVEEILNDVFQEDNSCNIEVLRYFNPAGAHPSGLLGEAPKSDYPNLFPLIMNIIIDANPSHLNIYGGDWPTPDGTAIRDYIHIMDLAEVRRASLSYLGHSVSGIKSLNIGTGVGYSVLDVVKAFEQISMVRIPIVFKP